MKAPGWERVGTTWCMNMGRARAEVSRTMNPANHIIEWHVLAWVGTLRDKPIVNEFHGQDAHSALGLGEDTAREFA